MTGEVIYMADVKHIPPKVVNSIHLHQRYTCTFDPNASPDQRWAWQVDFVRTYKHFGTAPSLSLADRRARRCIQQIVKGEVRMEEDGG